MIELRTAIEAFARHEVEFIIVGEIALYMHGYPHVTSVLEICNAFDQVNLERLAAALAPYHPRLRGLPPDLPFRWDKQTLQSGTNFTLTTDLGDIDLLGKVAGVGSYADALAASVIMTFYGIDCRMLSLDALIVAKRAAGRTKDLLALPELEALREVLNKSE